MTMPYESEPNVQNISDTLYRDIQISLLPFVGSNNGLSGNTINNYSINMLGGYSLGTRQIELGFFFNIDRGDVSWLQIGGVGNLVGRNVYGVQADYHQMDSLWLRIATRLALVWHGAQLVCGTHRSRNVHHRFGSIAWAFSAYHLFFNVGV